MPQILDYEKMILLENFKNPYQNALFSMIMASSKTEQLDQRALLLESLNYLGKAKKTEDSIDEKIIENSSLFKPINFIHQAEEGQEEEENKQERIYTHYRYTKKSLVPSAPILLARTPTSLIVKLPFFKPITDYRNWRQIEKLAVF
jgi:hypothetical protein